MSDDTPAQSTSFEDEFSKEVWETTYKHHTDTSIDDTFNRVSTALASVEKTPELQQEWSDKFFDMLTGFKVTVGGRIYSNAGTGWTGTTLLNCFVNPRASKNIDSLSNIMTNLNFQSQTLKSEGGWGENFSYIRPRGSFIYGIGVETPGAVKYMELFDKSSEIITSGSGKKSTNSKAKGKIRKGAMMGIIDVWHPDIIEFINVKQNSGRLTKFNLSVNCTDEFMTKVIKAEELLHDGQIEQAEAIKWCLRFPETTHEAYSDEWDGDINKWEQKGYPVQVYQELSVMWLWNLIMQSTYNRNEPGVLFIDRANHFAPLSYAETIFATNPCGEQVLAPGGVCNLGSINLTQFINDDRTGFDLVQFKKYVTYLVRFLDNVNDISEAPLEEYQTFMNTKRRIGCGVLGWGSALLMLKVRFGSKRADVLRDEVMDIISKTAYMYSIDLAEEKGAFSVCDNEKHSEGVFVNSLNLPQEYMEKLNRVGIRNSSLLSVQPTGNTSILANVVSGGLEPIFLFNYIRTVIVGTVPSHIEMVTPKWYEGEWFETELFKFTKEGDEQILRGVDSNGTVYKIDTNRGLTKEVLCEDYGVRYLKSLNEWDENADWASTTEGLSVYDHVKDLTGFAQRVDSACSKTINVPHEYPFDRFKDIYLSAYKSSFVKGVTTYRAGTMTTVLAAKETIDSEEEIILDDVSMPDSAPATMKTLRAERRKWYLTVVHHDENHERPFALFVKTNAHEKNVIATDAITRLFALARVKGIPEHHIAGVANKIDGDTNSGKVARLVSLLLRHGVLIKNIVHELDHVEDAGLGSFVFQIKKFLSSYIKDGEAIKNEQCQSCGSESIVYSEGCKKCVSCGTSVC